MWLVDIDNWFIQEMISNMPTEEPMTDCTFFGPFEIILDVEEKPEMPERLVKISTYRFACVVCWIGGVIIGKLI